MNPQEERKHLNEQYKKLANDFSIVIGTQNTNTNSRLARDTCIFKYLIENDGNTVEEVSRIICWYKHNQGKQFVPVIDSAPEFRVKYTRLIRAKNRGKNRGKNIY